MIRKNKLHCRTLFLWKLLSTTPNSSIKTLSLIYMLYRLMFRTTGRVNEEHFMKKLWKKFFLSEFRKAEKWFHFHFLCNWCSFLLSMEYFILTKCLPQSWGLWGPVKNLVTLFWSFSKSSRWISVIPWLIPLVLL